MIAIQLSSSAYNPTTLKANTNHLYTHSQNIKIDEHQRNIRQEIQIVFVSPVCCVCLCISSELSLYLLSDVPLIFMFWLCVYKLFALSVVSVAHRGVGFKNE